MVALLVETIRQQWRCARCGALLGEVVGESVIIAPRPNRRYIAPLTTEGIMAVCRCGHGNELYPDEPEPVYGHRVQTRRD